MTVGDKIKKIRTFRGMTQKELGLAIGFEEKGENGFGYDPLFIPDEVGLPGRGAACEANAAQRTYAQLSADEKDAISHRARALALMERELPAFLADTGILGAVCGPACPPKE